MELASCANTEQTGGMAGGVSWRRDMPAAASATVAAIMNMHEFDKQLLLSAHSPSHNPQLQMQSNQPLDNFLKA